MAQAKDWLGSFIEDEVRAAVAWKRGLESNPKVKTEKTERFNDDGSNFRSIATQPTIPSGARLQVIEVLTTGDLVTLYVTDGYSRIKAKLSTKAKTALEEELDEKIDVGTKGDIIVPREVKVESTPYGPKDGFIRLAIENLEYQFHLRKLLGQPKPIEDRAECVRLIEEIAEIRRKQYAPLEPPHTTLRRPSATTDDTPQSQRSVALSLRSSPNQIDASPSTQRGVATQIPTRRKLNGPTLARDGFEVEGGVNLSRPIERASSDNGRNASPVARKSPVARDVSSARLLSLLGKRKAEPSAKTTNERSVSPRISSPRVDSKGDNEPQRSAAGHLTQTAPQVVCEEIVSEQLPRSPQEVHRDYARRKIPRDQQKLLDQPSSWWPPLPGKQFPHPNVPIQLLNKWKSQVETEAKMKTSSKRPTPNPVLRAPSLERPVKANGKMLSSDSSPSESSSEDEEFSESQWPPSPSQKKPTLPPDSSMPSNSRPSTAGREIHEHTDHQTKLSTLDGNNSRPSTSESRKREEPPDSSNATFMKPSPRPIKRHLISQDSPSSTIIKGTQFAKKAEDDLEVEVPRSLGQDPALEHRKRRSEHMKAAQRRQWLQNNYVPDHEPRHSFSTIYSAYKRAHPKDVIKLSEFAEALCEVYPEVNTSPTKAVRSAPAKATHDIASSQQEPSQQVSSTGAADTPSVVATPVNGSGVSKLAPMPSSSVKSSRVLPWVPNNKLTPNQSALRPLSLSAAPKYIGSATSPAISTHGLATSKPLHAKSSINKQSTSRLPPRSIVNLSSPSTNNINLSSADQSPADPSIKPSQTPHPAQPARAAKSSPHQPPAKSAPAKHVEPASAAKAIPPPFSPFLEFTRTWKNLKPGGAFAVVADAQQKSRSASTRGRMNVLDWKL